MDEAQKTKEENKTEEEKKTITPELNNKNNDNKNQNETQNTNSNPFQTTTFHIINQDNNNNNLEGGKVRRKRRSKNEIEGRDFKCPNCGKSYLSAPALFNHRKNKHNYIQEGERKGRGRPRKDPLVSNTINQSKKKYETFFDSDLRKIKSDNNDINLDIIKKDLSDIFRQCKDTIFINVESVENYSFYQFLVNYWEKEKLDSYEECRSSLKNNQNTIIKFPPLDGVFYYYLKDIIPKTNVEYFWFITKFIVTFREYINTSKKDLVNKDYVTEDKQLYSQIYSAETIPDMCNDYFIDFMEPNNYFGLNCNELIELIQHFCFWLVSKTYTQSNLTLI